MNQTVNLLKNSYNSHFNRKLWPFFPFLVVQLKDFKNVHLWSSFRLSLAFISRSGMWKYVKLIWCIGIEVENCKGNETTNWIKNSVVIYLWKGYWEEKPINLIKWTFRPELKTIRATKEQIPTHVFVNQMNDTGLFAFLLFLHFNQYICDWTITHRWHQPVRPFVCLHPQISKWYDF